MAARRPLAQPLPNSTSSSLKSKTVPGAKTAVGSRLASAPPTEREPEIPSRYIPTPVSPRSNKKGDGEANIQVVVRCRCRSAKEMDESTATIVSTDGAKGRTVTIETGSTTSAMGVVTLAPTRTYPFDMVFGAEADQAMIYYDVVAPMLEEVVAGYNCTLFAYGQTGTGKTYTMQGDIVASPLGGPQASAGVIPRVLYNLFNQLETSKLDFSVKISFVELYNEELRDLLATDLSAPSGSAQPMGAGNSRQQGVLKIYDDASKRGVVLQGHQDTPVKDAHDALKLLAKGTERRQIAATNFNDHSSRSHSIFSITVHTKETSTAGEDLLRVGKFNLVDLAGSENIGRSGAENKRAREAGLINQSLLTLGRVINALVDGATHVPYRESKLTRLLQDSLGGRTKTCIIATISPARSNMEETVSTLDYALCAKSIRNKPELNQRMTRNSLLREYITEIEQLKENLRAAREKNGIYVTQDYLDGMHADNEKRTTERNEAKKQVDIIESQMRAVREDFDRSIALLLRRDKEIKETRQQLEFTNQELNSRNQELQTTRKALRDETLVREAHQITEQQLDVVATDLKLVVQNSLQDVNGLFGKLARQAKTMGQNVSAVSTHGSTLYEQGATLAQHLQQFQRAQGDLMSQLLVEADSLKTRGTKNREQQVASIRETLRETAERLEVIQHTDTSSSALAASMRTELVNANTGLGNYLKKWSEETKAARDASYQSMDAAITAHCLAAEKIMKTLLSVLDTTITSAKEHLRHEESVVAESKALAEKATSEEIEMLRAQNQSLERFVGEEQVRAAAMQKDITRSVAEMLKRFEDERNSNLQNMVLEFQRDNQKASTSLGQFSEEHDCIMDDIACDARRNLLLLDKKSTESEKVSAIGKEALTTAHSTWSEGLTELRQSVDATLEVHVSELRKRSHDLSEACDDKMLRMEQHKRARTDAIASLNTGMTDHLTVLENAVASSSRLVDESLSGIIANTTSLSSQSAEWFTRSNATISAISSSTRRIVSEGSRPEVQTGQTPQKRVWNYARDWQLTGSREAILNVNREGGISGIAHPREPSITQRIKQEEDDVTATESVMDDQVPPPPTSVDQPPPPVAVASTLSSKSAKSRISQQPAPLRDRPTNISTTRPGRRLR